MRGPKKTKTRLVIVTADTLAEMFKDYLTNDVIPANANVVRVMVHPRDRKVALVMESAEWQGEQPTVVADFSLKRVYGV